MTNKRTLLFIVTIISVLLLCSCGPDPGSNDSYHAEGIDSYSKETVIDKYAGDLDSDLSVFPDKVISDKAEYSADFAPNLFDTDGRMILVCEYDDKQFTDEIARLQSLTKTIEYDDEQYTNNVVYDEDSYNYPAYITIDGFGDTYEYALIDRSNNRIVYIYLAYPDSDTLNQYEEYTRKDLSTYYDEDAASNAFSMYNHYFDDGESWVEFDD